MHSFKNPVLVHEKDADGHDVYFYLGNGIHIGRETLGVGAQTWTADMEDAHVDVVKAELSIEQLGGVASSFVAGASSASGTCAEGAGAAWPAEGARVVPADYGKPVAMRPSITRETTRRVGGRTSTLAATRSSRELKRFERYIICIFFSVRIKVKCQDQSFQKKTILKSSLKQIVEYLVEEREMERSRTFLEITDSNGRAFRYIRMKDRANPNSGKVEYTSKMDDVFRKMIDHSSGKGTPQVRHHGFLEEDEESQFERNEEATSQDD